VFCGLEFDVGALLAGGAALEGERALRFTSLTLPVPISVMPKTQSFTLRQPASRRRRAQRLGVRAARRHLGIRGKG
jgi:hypothetical protein